MPHTEQPKQLAFPTPFPGLFSIVFALDISRDSIPSVLGDPVRISEMDAQGQCDFWAFEYPCGLQVVYQFPHREPSGFVLADYPEPQHVGRHIPFAPDVCMKLDEQTLKAEQRRLLGDFPDRHRELNSLHAYQVWRQGTDGNAFRIGEATSKRDADCWVNHFESLGHHQHYWCSKISET